MSTALDIDSIWQTHTIYFGINYYSSKHIYLKILQKSQLLIWFAKIQVFHFLLFSLLPAYLNPADPTLFGLLRSARSTLSLITAVLFTALPSVILLENALYAK